MTTITKLKAVEDAFEAVLRWIDDYAETTGFETVEAMADAALPGLRSVIAEMEAGERSLELKFSKAAADQGFTLVPLTDEQIEAVWVEQGLDDCDPHGFARAIEAAHGITTHLPADVEGEKS